LYTSIRESKKIN